MIFAMFDSPFGYKNLRQKGGFVRKNVLWNRFHSNFKVYLNEYFPTSNIRHIKA